MATEESKRAWNRSMSSEVSRRVRKRVRTSSKVSLEWLGRLKGPNDPAVLAREQAEKIIKIGGGAAEEIG
jgi:hypothetical protein